ncbi:hypothetical protein AAKU64_003534 [Undibacterium sp. GrIS 1.8]
MQQRRDDENRPPFWHDGFDDRGPHAIVRTRRLHARYFGGKIFGLIFLNSFMAGIAPITCYPSKLRELHLVWGCASHHEALSVNLHLRGPNFLVGKG